MKILYVPTPRRIRRYRDTDYLVSYQLMRLAEFNKDLTMVRSDNLAFDIRFYARVALSLAKRRLSLPIPRSWTWVLSQNYWMPARDAEAMGADAILAYERFPSNATLPVIWMAGSTDVGSLRKRGMTESIIQKQIEFKRESNARAVATVLPTYSKKLLFDEVINPSKPTIVIPFFQPIVGIAPKEFGKKWEDLTQIKLLFIGRAAVRKGLALVLEAYALLQARYPGKVSLHVVTTFQDGKVSIPALPGLVLEESLVSHERSIELMRLSHYLVMPSVLEEYGLVYVEAMAQGTIPLATDSPVQRELLDEGRAGLLVDRSATGIADALGEGIENHALIKSLAQRTMNHWITRYAPEVIARQFAGLAGASLELNQENGEKLCASNCD